MSQHSSQLQKKVDYALIWAFVEACGYKIIYLILHIFFFKQFSSSLYTFQATIFAIMYMGVTIFNRGYDQALLYYFNQSIHSHAGTYHLLKHILYESCITIGLILVAATCIHYTHSIPFLSSDLIIILSLLTFVEITKKNLKVILYLTFFNRYVTVAELMGLAIYTCLAIHTLMIDSSSIIPLFTYLLCVNSAVVVFFASSLYLNSYKNNTNASLLSFNHISVIQCQSYFLQLSKILVSSQFLMPFYALSMQLNESTHFFVISTIIQSGEFILYKLCHVSGSTFFVYDTSNHSFLSNQMANILLKHLIPFYTLVVIVAWIPIFFLLPHTPSNIYFTILYGATLLIDNLLLLYEKYAIIHNKIFDYFIYFALLSAITWSLLYTTTSNLFIATTLFLVGKIMLTIFVYNKNKVI